MALQLLADPETDSIEDLVDLERFPLCDEDNSPALNDLIATSRRALKQDGATVLPGFLLPAALASIRAEMNATASHVPIRSHAASVYHRNDLTADLDPDDPRVAKQVWSAGHITRDMIPAFSPAHRLYVSPAIKRFVAAIVGLPTVYEYADPLAGLIATVLPADGGRYPWHYDTNEFVVTVLIQKPEQGGRFEYHQDLRSPGDENLAELDHVLRGRSSRPATQVVTSPGDLTLFLGRYSLHQVTEVKGPHTRLALVMSYAEKPGVIGPLARTRSVYGRVTEAHLVAEQHRLAPDGLIL